MRNPCAALEGCSPTCLARFRKMFLMSWGSNQFGQLGLKCDIDTPDPNCLAFIRPMCLPPPLTTKPIFCIKHDVAGTLRKSTIWTL
jgi:hypothetical protein